MRHIIEILKASALISICFLAVTLGLGIRSVATNLNKSLNLVNAQKTGVIAVLNDDLSNLRLSLDNANKAAIDERLFLEKTQPDEVKRVNVILDNANKLIQGSTKDEAQLTQRATLTIDAGTDAVKGLLPLEAQLGRDSETLNKSLEGVNTSIKDIDALVNDPANVKTLNNVQEGTAAMAGAAKDGQQWLHSALHPGWVKKVWGITLDVAHVFNPL